MRFLNPAYITVPPTRIRKKFDKKELEELRESIVENGLFHPILVKETEKKGETQHYELIAGERRLRTINLLHAEDIHFKFDGKQVDRYMIPTTLASELDPLSLKAIELQENLRRASLTWQEEARGIAELHILEETRHGPDNWTQADTARELTGDDTPGTRKGHKMVRDAIVLSRHLDDVQVKNAPDTKTAMKIVKRKLQKELTEFLDESIDTSRLDGGFTFEQKDAMEALPEMEAAQFDCIVADPPYSVGAHKFKSYDSVLDRGYIDNPEIFFEFCHLLGKEGYRVAKEKAHLYIFHDIRNFGKAAKILRSYEWNVWKWPIIWHKGSRISPNPELGPARSYEAILYANKGNKPTTALYSDHLEAPLETQRIHADQKPVAVYANLLKRSCLPGDRVLDPCAGSGTIIFAGRPLKLEVTALELDPEMYNLAQKRIKSGDLPPESGLIETLKQGEEHDAIAKILAG